jgi:hypothetical protein
MRCVWLPDILKVHADQLCVGCILVHVEILGHVLARSCRVPFRLQNPAEHILGSRDLALDGLLRAYRRAVQILKSVAGHGLVEIDLRNGLL